MLPVPEVSQADVERPTRGLEVVPRWDDIPKKYRNKYTRWVKVVNTWRERGLLNTRWTPNEGVDTEAALRAVNLVLADPAVPEELKVHGVAYMLGEWFANVVYNKGPLKESASG